MDKDHTKHNHSTPKLEVLTNLLVGMKTFPVNIPPVTINLDYRGMTGTGGVSIVPMSYDSRPYPAFSTDKKTGKVIHSQIIEKIPALRLEPTNESKRKRKGIIALHQHALDFSLGKSEPAGLMTGPSGKEQHYGLELAKRGYTVFCFDFSPFEDRQIRSLAEYRESHKSIIGVDERFIKQEHSLDGLELMGQYVLDCMSAVDVMINLGIEDIGIIGHSLGGMVSVYAMAADPRIKAGVSNCGVSTFEAIRNAPMIHNLAYSVHGMKRDFGEWYDLCALIEPRPLFVSSGTEDRGLPIDGAEDFAKFGRKHYRGNEPLLVFNKFEGRHGFPSPVREAAYDFLERAL
jgi:dienelactone hydrolase